MLWGSMLQHAALWRESPLDLGGDEDQATLMWQQCCVYPRTQEFEDHLINIVWVTREGCHHLWNTLGQDIKAILGQTAATQEAQEMMIWVFRKNLSDCQKPATAFEAISQLTPPPATPSLLKSTVADQQCWQQSATKQESVAQHTCNQKAPGNTLLSILPTHRVICVQCPPNSMPWKGSFVHYSQADKPSGSGQKDKWSFWLNVASEENNGSILEAR